MRENTDDHDEQAKDSSALLDDPRRRYLLYCLYLYANPVLLSDIAYQVTIWEENKKSEDIAKERYRTYMSLYHDHLPELTEADIVEYDQQEDRVELGPRQKELTGTLERYLSQEIDTLLAAEQDSLGSDLPAAVTDDVYRALAASERRQLLSYLLEESQVTLDEATTRIVGWKVTQNQDIGPDERDRIRGALHHVHLPLLEEAGLVTYDMQSEEIQLSSLTDPIRSLIQSESRDIQMTPTARLQGDATRQDEADTTESVEKRE